MCECEFLQPRRICVALREGCLRYGIFALFATATRAVNCRVSHNKIISSSRHHNTPRDRYTDNNFATPDWCLLKKIASVTESEPDADSSALVAQTDNFDFSFSLSRVSIYSPLLLHHEREGERRVRRERSKIPLGPDNFAPRTHTLPRSMHCWIRVSLYSHADVTFLTFQSGLLCWRWLGPRGARFSAPPATQRDALAARPSAG